MAKATKTAAVEAFSIIELKRKEVTLRLIGQSPLVFNRMAHQPRTILLLGQTKKTPIERAMNQKHDPIAEYRDSVHAYRDDPKASTYLRFPSSAFRRAVASAALDTPGAKKAEVGRLIWIRDDYVPIYGIPQLIMPTVRNNDAARTPDIRSLACLPRWATTVTIEFAEGKLTPTILFKLMTTAGMIIGIGDGRQEKGKKSFGQFWVADTDPQLEKEYEELKRISTYKAQYVAMMTEHPACYDEETQRLFDWYTQKKQADTLFKEDKTTRRRPRSNGEDDRPSA